MLESECFDKYNSCIFRVTDSVGGTGTQWILDFSVGFICTSLQLQLIITAHTLNFF
jgi:hypothetical protein